MAYDPPADADAAWRDAAGTLSQGDLLAEAASSELVARAGGCSPTSPRAPAAAW